MSTAGPDDPLWFKEAVIYEIHVRAFHDSDADGIGDFRGLAEKLDYLKDLGVNALWLLPFYPSPLKDDGYDIADYTDIHPSYGTMADFKHFLREAHARGLRVITELVLNHTSDQHPWFQRARRAPAKSPQRDYYIWSETPERYKEARIIFKDSETSNWAWDSVARRYYWHRFYSHQPDLNFDSPAVQRQTLRLVDYWLELGVDGLRLDAVPYLFEREGTSCENLPETHGFLKKIRQRADAKFKNRLLLAEANQWPEDAVAYFGEGDECHMAFHFPIMPRMFMAVHMEDRYPLIDILSQTPAIPPSCQWALFLRNHDELTLEMVTDEERDYMYRVYAHDRQARINLGIRRRLAPLLRNNRRKIELLNGLLFSLPGTPIIYYGDEIGMGDNIYLGDRNGVRTPMQWSSDRNAGFSRANPQRLYLPINIDPEFHYEAVNVEAQQNNPHSLLWWMKRLIALSRRYKAFGRGTMEILTPENRKVFAFLRSHGNERILVVANLSRFVQFVQLDLSAFQGRTPVELFGRTPFPTIGSAPYLLTLGPHGFFWFALEPSRVEEVVPAGAEPPTLRAREDWKEIFGERSRAPLEEALAAFLQGRRWFAGQGMKLRSVRILDLFPLDLKSQEVVFLYFQVEFVEGQRQTYGLLVGRALGDRAEQARRNAASSVIAPLHVQGAEGLLVEVVQDPQVAGELLDGVARRRQFKGGNGRIALVPSTAFSRLRGKAAEPLPATPVRGERSDSSIIFGNRLIMKLLRRVEPGENPELEVGRFLTERARFEAVAPVAGSIEYHRQGADPVILGIVHGYAPHQGDAWRFTLDNLESYFESVLAQPRSLEAPSGRLLDLIQQTPPAEIREAIGTYLEVARLIGRRIAELHLALASADDDPAFAPEPFTPFYQRSVYQSMRSQVGQVFPALRRRLKDLDAQTRGEAECVLELEPRLLKRFLSVSQARISAQRIRCHGNLHLGQLLYTGKDFVILDFEGEPARPLSERRIKRSPLRDVAGMLRSFHYAANAAVLARQPQEQVPERVATLQTAGRMWHAWVCSAFFRSYMERMKDSSLLPSGREGLETLLDAFQLDTCVYEIGYELGSRPGWLRIPLRGILYLLGNPP
jgi:maltose alpha-D-glucosyltransferase/alpha-amylase